MDTDEYKKRREKLFSVISGTVVLFAAPKAYRNADSEYVYRQNSYFYYLTGISFGDCAVLLNKKKFILFVKTQSKQEMVFSGKTKKADLKKQIGCDQVLPLEKLPQYVKRLKNIHSLKNASGFLKKYKEKNLLTQLINMRLIKSQSELKLLQKAAKITLDMFGVIQQKKDSVTYAYELKAFIDYIYQHNNTQHAFLPIVTQQGTILHNNSYAEKIKKDALLLIDTGAEYKNYASDFTRTFIVRSWSAEYRKLCAIVKRAKAECIAQAKPGMTFSELQKIADHVILTELKKEGYVKGKLEELEKKKIVRLFFVHGVTHHVGLDVHDCSEMNSVTNKKIRQKWQTLVENTVFTIEPGIYFNEQLIAQTTQKKHLNISKIKKLFGVGIRFEDTFVMTNKGAVLITDL